MLTDLRLPGISKAWHSFTERADTEGWPAARLLAALTEFEIAERETRRMQRHLTEARLPPGKTLDTFDFYGSTYGLKSPGLHRKHPPAHPAHRKSLISLHSL